MPIPINLKQILQSDTQQEKLDKVNYNFDQLVANGGGPMGVTGDIGEAGLQGVTGDQGPQGIEGSQGFQGPADDSADSRWKDGASWTNGSLRIKTIVPKHEIDSFQTSANFAPTNVVLGLANNDAEYNDASTIANAVLDSVLTINRNSNYHDSNIRLIAEKDINSYLDITLTNYPSLVQDAPPTSVLEFEFAQSVINGEYRWNADKYVINDVNGNEMMSMDATNGATFNGSFLSTSSAIFTGSIFRINNGIGASTDPDVDKIAVSLDNLGTIGFKTASEVGASVPIGTIVSFLYDTYIDPINFTQNQTINMGSNPDQVDIVVGRGVSGTEYEGWYLCNGQTWKNGAISYTVPNLNSFSFDFSTNLGGVSSLSSASTPNLLGGGEFAFSQNATNISYTIDVDSTNAWVADTATIEATFPYVVMKTPQLIYLGSTDLWYNVSNPPPASFNGAYFKLLENGTYADVIMPNGIGGYGPDLWREIDKTTNKQPIANGGREILGNATDPGIWSEGTTEAMTIQYGQPNIFDLRLTARGKDQAWNAISSNTTEPESQSYSWFTDWTERYDGSSGSLGGTTSPWNDTGAYDSTSYYNEGDIFYYNGEFYTVSPGLSMGGVDVGTAGLNGAAIADPTQHIVQTDSSWEKGGNVNGVNGAPLIAYFYRLPKVEDAEEAGWYFNPNNQTQPSNPPPTNNRFSLTPGFGRGGYNDWSTGVGEIEFFTNPSQPQNGTTPIWPAFYEYPTVLGTKEMYDQQGRWSWPAEVFLDITNSMGVPDGMIQVPVISRWNKGLIEDEYPGLIPASEWNDHFPQYKNPYSYTEGTDHWATGTGVGPALSGQWGTIDWMYAGGWDISTSNNVSKEWDYWYTGQKDTAFRRYQRVEFKVLLTTEISNQIHSYLQDNPGSTIKFRTAWWSDKEQNGSSGQGQFIDPDGNYFTYASDYSDAAWNRQPHGMGYNSAAGSSNTPGPNALSIEGTSSFLLDDWALGASNGTATVQYLTNDPSQTPILISGTGAHPTNGSRYTAVIGPPDNVTGIGNIVIDSVVLCSNAPLGLTTNDLVIQHSTGNTAQITYTGSLIEYECPQATTHALYTLLPVVGYIMYNRPDGVRILATIPANSSLYNPEIICGYNFATVSGINVYDQGSICI